MVGIDLPYGGPGMSDLRGDHYLPGETFGPTEAEYRTTMEQHLIVTCRFDFFEIFFFCL
jgi:hypothetical protein